jgi:hypothetical protein
MSFIAGAYSATWNAANIGRTESGFDVTQSFHDQPVIADSFGEMVVDFVQQGVDTIVNFTFIEYDLLATAIFAQSGGAGLGNNLVGMVLVQQAIAKSLVLTAIGTTTPAAASAGYKTWTFPNSILADDISVLLSSKLRKGPARFRCFPTLATGIVYTVA